MSSYASHGRLIVWGSFLVAILFQIVPLPGSVEAWRPDWLLMVMFYWAMALPYRYNILSAWCLGVILDILLGAHLGLRALAMSVVIYVVVLHCQRLRNFSIWQQVLVIASLILLYHALIFCGQLIVSDAKFDTDLFLPVISSVIIWPWLFSILRRTRRTYRVR